MNMMFMCMPIHMHTNMRTQIQNMYIRPNSSVYMGVHGNAPDWKTLHATCICTYVNA